MFRIITLSLTFHIAKRHFVRRSGNVYTPHYTISVCTSIPEGNKNRHRLNRFKVLYTVSYSLIAFSSNAIRIAEAGRNMRKHNICLLIYSWLCCNIYLTGKNDALPWRPHLAHDPIMRTSKKPNRFTAVESPFFHSFISRCV